MFPTVILEKDVVLLSAEDFIEETKRDLNSIRRNYFSIGHRLNQAVKEKYYKVLGYNDIYELAEDQFGFQKTTTKNLMAVNLTYNSQGSWTNPSRLIAPQFEKYNQTQLVEMLPLAEWQRENVPADFTIEELRDYKKIVRLGFDLRLLGVTGNREIANDPKKYVNLYREKVKAGEIVSKKKQEPKNQNLNVAPGQIEMDEKFFSNDVAVEPARDITSEAKIENVVTISGQSTDQEIEISAPSQSTDQETKEQAVKKLVKDMRSVRENAVTVKLHNFKNSKERYEFIEKAENFPFLVLENEEIGLTIRRCDFANGAKLYRMEYKFFSYYDKQFKTKYKLSLVIPEGESMPKSSTFSVGDSSGKCFTIEGMCETNVVCYMSENRKKI